MYQTFLTFIEKKRLLSPKDKVLVGVSGGVDSIVLLDLLVNAGYEVGVAHVNYHLRGEASNQDAILVEELCKQKNIPFFRYDVSDETYTASGSTQMVAREIRYRFFEELSEKHGYRKIATAHHANDNLETVLFNLTKGTGISGLKGIAAKRGKRVRPLLFATKDQLYQYARQNNLTWREDDSNQKNAYKRNLIRNEVIPVLQTINPALLETFQHSLVRFQGAADILEDRKKEILTTNWTTDAGVEKLETEWVKNDPTSQTLLFEIMKPYELNFSQCTDLWQAILKKSVGADFSTQVYDITLDRGQVIIRKPSSDQMVREEIQKGQQKARIGNSYFTLELTGENSISVHTDCACLDAHKIRYPLIVRSWRQGDAFRPLGMTGEKKVSDFMIDSKIPVSLKKDVLIMESAGEIVWVVGLRIDDRFKVTSATRQMLRITKSDV